MKRKKKNRTPTFSVDLSASWSVVKVFLDGSETVLESGLTWTAALPLAKRHLTHCQPGETVSIREAPVWEGALLA